MACDLLNAYAATGNSCKISMAGTGTRAYLFLRDEWKAKIDDRVKRKPPHVPNPQTYGLPTPGKYGIYGLDKNGNYDTDAVIKLMLLDLYAIDIKTDSGQVTSEKGEDNKAASQIGQFVIDGNIEAFNEIARSLAFKDFGMIIPKVGGGYYVVMSPWKSAKLQNAYDSGTTFDSDHGFTAQVSASPCEYGVTYLLDGTEKSHNYKCEIHSGFTESDTCVLYVSMV